MQTDALARTLSNLMNNGVEATKNSPIRLQVTSFVSSERFGVRIQDFGCGIEPEKIPLLFQPGFSLRKPEGSGLGLYYGKSVVESQGGQLSLDSIVGEGTTVTLQMPLTLSME